MTKYAKETDVSVARSRAEVEETLERYGASGFGYSWQEDDFGRRIVAIQFEIDRRRVLLRLPMPDPDAEEFKRTPTGQKRQFEAVERAYQQAVRQRWRALNLVVKAKLEAVETGIETVEQAFLANLMLPSGETVGEWVGPQIEEVYRTGQMPSLLPGMPSLPPAARIIELGERSS